MSQYKELGIPNYGPTSRGTSVVAADYIVPPSGTGYVNMHSVKVTDEMEAPNADLNIRDITSRNITAESLTVTDDLVWATESIDNFTINNSLTLGTTANEQGTWTAASKQLGKKTSDDEFNLYANKITFKNNNNHFDDVLTTEEDPTVAPAIEDRFVFDSAVKAPRWITGGAAADSGFYHSSGSKIYLDGGGDTHISESSANVVDVVVGGTNILKLNNADIVMPATSKLRLDGSASGDSYLVESGANQVDVVAGGSTSVSHTSSSSTVNGVLNVVKNVNLSGVTAPGNPASGKAELYVDSSGSLVKIKYPSGK